MTPRKIAIREWKPALRLPRNWLFTTLARWSLAVVNASVAGSPLVAERASAKLPSENGSATHTARLQAETAEVNVEYLRHMYVNTRSWYTASEMKAQLLLAVNGVFVTVLFGLLFGRPADARAKVSQFGSGTLILIGVTAGALVGAIACATLCLRSLHGRAKAELTQLGVKRGESPSYQPEVLWYFGHLAHLQPNAVRERLRVVDRQFEIDALSYNIVDLARKVFRKHKLVNAGWAFTALALVALVIAGVSLFA